MKIEVGKIPFKEGEATNQQIHHRPVFIRSYGSSYRLEVEGYSSGELHPETADYGKILQAAKKFIRRQNGSAYKKEIIVAQGGLSSFGRKIVDSSPAGRVQPFSTE